VRAQGLIEYALIVALVAILAIAAIIIFGPALSSFLAARG
jgi:Flp pilus assembly pilin Flp